MDLFDDFCFFFMKSKYNNGTNELYDVAYVC